MASVDEKKFFSGSNAAFICVCLPEVQYFALISATLLRS